MKNIWMASLAVAAALGAGCDRGDYAAKNDTAGTAARAEVKASDRDFVQEVSRANAAEVNLAKLAVEHAVSADVKKFAQMVVDDHTAAGARLSSVAAESTIDAPGIPDDAHVSLREKLVAKQGLDFDKDYIDAMIDDHQTLVDKLESRIDKSKVDANTKAVTPETSDDPVTRRINAWAADTYPVASGHLQAARDLKDTLKKRSTH